jgi:hypothetical protein
MGDERGNNKLIFNLNDIPFLTNNLNLNLSRVYYLKRICEELGLIFMMLPFIQTPYIEVVDRSFQQQEGVYTLVF